MLIKLFIIFTLLLTVIVSLTINYYKNFKGNDSYKLYTKNYSKIDKKIIKGITQYLQDTITIKATINGRSDPKSRHFINQQHRQFIKENVKNTLLKELNDPIMLMDNGIDRFQMKEVLYANLEYFLKNSSVLNGKKINKIILKSNSVLVNGVFYVNYEEKNYNILNVLNKIDNFNEILEVKSFENLDKNILNKNIILFQTINNSYIELDTFIRFLRIQQVNGVLNYSTVDSIIDILMASQNVHDYEILLDIYSNEVNKASKEILLKEDDKFLRLEKACEIKDKILNAYENYNGSMPLEWALELYTKDGVDDVQ